MSDVKKVEAGIGITVPVTVSMEMIGSLLCSALDGGSNYWYMIVDQCNPAADVDQWTYRADFEKKEVYQHIDWPLNAGGWLKFETLDKDKIDGKKERILNLESIESGLKIMARDCPGQFATILDESADACTGDVFLQCCLFGKVVFG